MDKEQILNVMSYSTSLQNVVFHRKLVVRKTTTAIFNSTVSPWLFFSINFIYGTGAVTFALLMSCIFHSPGAAAKETAVIWIATIVCGKKKTQHTESDDDNFIQLVRCSLQDALREITTFTGKCVTGSRSLTKSVISVKGVNNITRGHRFGKKPMRALQFHPTRKVLTCADENGLLSLPETEEAFLQSIHFKALPITSVSFTADDAKVMQMRTPYEINMHMRRFSLSFDGRYIAVLACNEVHILTSLSSEYIGVLTASTKIASVQFFLNDSSTCLENGQVLIWNIRKLKEQQTFYDEGSVKETMIRISESGQYIACGSSTGIVNSYDSADVLKTRSPDPPVKALDNLTTSIDCMAFNTGLKIIVSLGKVTVTDFSPESVYMGVGDDKSFLSLFRLSHTY
uniref:WD_REPEATS_REGION domain-containing protein n=1 Tax=Wuchereria bancrofti TaxID=6293 RepID=A0AAF5PL52_WUCBA